MKPKSKVSDEERSMTLTKIAGVAVVCIVAGLFFLRSETGQKFVNLPFSGVSSEAAGAKIRKVARPVPEQYIVVLKSSTSNVDEEAEQLSRRYQGQLRKTYKSALKGFAVKMPEAQVEKLAHEDVVEYIEEDSETSVFTTQSNATWGLDRIDQKNLPLSGTYNYTGEGQGVTAYIIDTGIRVTHQEFGGRASIGFDAVGDGQGANDCHGHGTHVAGTVGSNTYGVAKKVNLVAVRTMQCTGRGLVSDLIEGVDWVTANAVRPAVVNMSIGVSSGVTTLDTAITNSTKRGIVYAVAAGNSNLDSCDYSPSRVRSAITVGATTSSDFRASYSNWGACVDVFAPGTGITSLSNLDDTSIRGMSGTSMASPHVAGAAALYLGANPAASVSTVTDAILANAVRGVLTDVGSGSVNYLLHNTFTLTQPPAEEPPVEEPPIEYPPAPTVSCSSTLYTSSIGAGRTNYHTVNGWSGRAGAYTATLTGQSSGVMTLALEKKSGKNWNQVITSASSSTVTVLNYTGTKGSYRWRVTSSGDNSYALCSKTP